MQGVHVVQRYAKLVPCRPVEFACIARIAVQAMQLVSYLAAVLKVAIDAQVHHSSKLRS